MLNYDYAVCYHYNISLWKQMLELRRQFKGRSLYLLLVSLWDNETFFICCGFCLLIMALTSIIEDKLMLTLIVKEPMQKILFKQNLVKTSSQKYSKSMISLYLTRNHIETNNIFFYLFFYLLSAGSLVGHFAGYPDFIWSDGLHRLPLQPHPEHQKLGVTSNFWSLSPVGIQLLLSWHIMYLNVSIRNIDMPSSRWGNSFFKLCSILYGACRWLVRTLTRAQQLSNLFC